MLVNKNFGMLRKLRRALNREDSDVVRKGSFRSRSKSRKRSRSRRQRSSSRGRNQGCSSGSKQRRDSARDRSKRHERSTSSDGSWYEEMRAHYKREKAACKQTSPKLKLLERLPTKTNPANHDKNQRMHLVLGLNLEDKVDENELMKLDWLKYVEVLTTAPDIDHFLKTNSMATDGKKKAGN